MSLQDAGGPPNLLLSNGHDGAADECVSTTYVSWMRGKKKGNYSGCTSPIKNRVG